VLKNVKLNPIKLKPVRESLSEIRERLKEVRKLRKQMMENPLEMPPIASHSLGDTPEPRERRSSIMKNPKKS
jgi:hypothetical protein